MRQCGAERDVVHHIEHSLLGGALGEDRGLGDVKLQVSILIEYQFNSGPSEFTLKSPRWYFSVDSSVHSQIIL